MAAAVICASLQKTDRLGWGRWLHFGIAAYILQVSKSDMTIYGGAQCAVFFLPQLKRFL
jgi:hypothetical protein